MPSVTRIPRSAQLAHAAACAEAAERIHVFLVSVYEQAVAATRLADATFASAVGVGRSLPEIAAVAPALDVETKLASCLAELDRIVTPQLRIAMQAADDLAEALDELRDGLERDVDGLERDDG